MFARFLQEFYNPEDLLYFIFVRNTIAKSFHVSFKGRWAKADGGPGRQPLPLWMSYKECLHITKVLFDDDNKVREFMQILNSQMVGQKSDVSDTRRIDISMFLHFAVVDYHQTHEAQNDGGAFFVPPLTSPHPATKAQPQVTSKVITPNTVNLFDIASSDDHMVENHLDSYLAALHSERREDRGSIGSGDYILDKINLQSIAYHQQHHYEEEEVEEEVEEDEVPVDSNDIAADDIAADEDINEHQEVYVQDEIGVEGGDDDGEEEEADEFTYVQLEVEDNVLAKVLIDTPDEIIEYIAPEIQNHLRLQIHSGIENLEINDLEHFKDTLIAITEDPSFIKELETFRDELLEQLMREVEN